MPSPPVPPCAPDPGRVPEPARVLEPGGVLESARAPEPALTPRRGRPRGRRRGILPLACATVATLVLGGASAARAATDAPLDARTDLEFSLDGLEWTSSPDPVLGSWGCDLAGGPSAPIGVGPVGGAPGADPCSMSPGESVDRTYHVRNATTSGRTGRYAVGIGDFVVSRDGEFDVTSTIAGPGPGPGPGPGSELSRTVTVYGAGSPRAGDSPEPGREVTALDLAPGQSARVVDAVSVPRGAAEATQRQSIAPMIWVSFADTEPDPDAVDSDADGLPDRVEAQIGTDPADPRNRLPGATAGRGYGPERFLGTRPADTELVVDAATLPPGMRVTDGVVTGTPTRAGTYDVRFTVTMPDGSAYSSVRRVVVGPGGAAALVDLIWPWVGAALIGVVGGHVVGHAAGSLAGVVWDPAEGSAGAGSAGRARAGEPEGAGPATNTGPDRSGVDSAGADSAGLDSGDRADGGAAAAREGAPSDEWVRANSGVRGSLADTGVAAADLLLWALTAAAAGATLVLLASRRRGHPDPDEPAGD